MNANKFLSAVDAINANNYNYGNDILYSSFNFSKGILPIPGSTVDSKLSSAMSIIGKSYSADPTRSAPKGVLQNNGTGDAFDLLANKIVAHTNYKTLYDRINALSLKTLDYKNVDDDKKVLIDTIFCVALLNHILRNVINMTANNKNIDTESKNTISFCSKFLHFLCPDTVFIKDSISLENGKDIFKNLSLTGNTICYPDLEYDFDPKEINAIKEYIDHVIRAYSVAKFLHDNSKKCTAQIASDPQNSTYMPRLVDSIFMNYKL